jgi:hypothetical protein
MNYLVLGILVIEIIRLIFAIQDSRRVNETNKRANERMDKMAEYEIKRDDEWKEIRRVEIAELKELVKDGNLFQEMIEELARDAAK